MCFINVEKEITEKGTQMPVLYCNHVKDEALMKNILWTKSDDENCIPVGRLLYHFSYLKCEETPSEIQYHANNYKEIIFNGTAELQNPLLLVIFEANGWHIGK